MSLSHNSETLDGEQVDCMTGQLNKYLNKIKLLIYLADFHGRPSSSSRFMGSKGITKDGFTDEVFN